MLHIKIAIAEHLFRLTPLLVKYNVWVKENEGEENNFFYLIIKKIKRDEKNFTLFILNLFIY